MLARLQEIAAFWPTVFEMHNSHDELLCIHANYHAESTESSTEGDRQDYKDIEVCRVLEFGHCARWGPRSRSIQESLPRSLSLNESEVRE